MKVTPKSSARLITLMASSSGGRVMGNATNSYP
jgi:hypothetical protein